jgi:hypothetical protein
MEDARGIVDGGKADRAARGCKGTGGKRSERRGRAMCGLSANVADMSAHWDRLERGMQDSL